MTRQSTASFEKYIFLFSMVFLTVALIDFGMAAAYKWVTGEYFYYKVADPNRGVNRLFRTRHQVYHHDLKPNADLSGRWGPLKYEIVTNSLGFKDAAPNQVPLESDKYRLLLIGDSFTEGVGFSYQETFPGLIDKAMALRNIELFNAGVSSYSPSIYLAKTRYLIQEVGFDFDELVVFLDISDVDDEANVYLMDESGNVLSRSKPGGLSRIKPWFRKNSILYAIPRMVKIRRNFSHIPENLGDQNLMRYPRALWTVDDTLLKKWGQKGLRLMIERMNQLYELLKRHEKK